MRNLATVQIVKEVMDIPGKDKIGYVSFKNIEWKVIASKILKPGDKVIYIEYDSILPIHPAFEFLRKRCFSEKLQGFKIGCMKMAGLVSYGLLLTYDNITEFITRDNWDKYTEGEDLTDILEISQKEDDTPSILTKKPPFIRRLWKRLAWKLFRITLKNNDSPKEWPSFIPKTDETRAEVLPYLFRDYLSIHFPVYTTVKVDGQSVTFIYKENDFYVTSRNCVLYKNKITKATKQLCPRNANKYRTKKYLFLYAASKYNVPYKMLSTCHSNVAIQCEQAGPGIQGNKMGLEDVELYIFNFFDIAVQKYYSWNELKDVSYNTGISTVPFIEESVFHWKNIDELYEYSKGMYGNGHPREGVVIRAMTNELYAIDPDRKMSNQWSFKVINPDYLV
jgi:hypothetical protein